MKLLGSARDRGREMRRGRASFQIFNNIYVGGRGWEKEKRLCAYECTFNTLPYINTALTGANPTVSQSCRRKSPAAWDSRKMTFYSECLRDKKAAG